MESILKESPHERSYDDLKRVDVICEHTVEGEVIPLKMRVKHDNGEYQTYRIDSYKDKSGNGSYTTRDGIYITNETDYFECSIGVLGRVRVIRLYFRPKEGIWRLGI